MARKESRRSGNGRPRGRPDQHRGDGAGGGTSVSAGTAARAQAARERVLAWAAARASKRAASAGHAGLHRPHPGQGLAELTGHSPQPGLALAGAPQHRAGEASHREGGHRHHRQRHQRQPPVEGDRHCGQHQHGEPVADPRPHGVDGRRLHRGDVGREAREEVPAHPLAELHRRDAEERIEQGPSDAGHGALTELPHPGELRGVGDALHRGDGHQEQRQPVQQPTPSSDSRVGAQAPHGRGPTFHRSGG